MPKKPTKPEPKPDLVYVPEGELPKLFLVYLASGEWRTKEGGSSASLLSAGTFAEGVARELIVSGDSLMPLERAVREATRAGNPVVVAAIAALGAR